MLGYKGFKQNYCNIKLLFPIDWKLLPKLKRITEDDVTRLIDQAFIFSFVLFLF